MCVRDMCVHDICLSQLRRKPRHLYIFVQAAPGSKGDASTYHVLCIRVLVVGEILVDNRLEIASGHEF